MIMFHANYFYKILTFPSQAADNNQFQPVCKTRGKEVTKQLLLHINAP